MDERMQTTITTPTTLLGNALTQGIYSPDQAIPPTAPEGESAQRAEENWYDPEGADRYSAAQAFLTSNATYTSNSHMGAAAPHPTHNNHNLSIQSNFISPGYNTSGTLTSAYGALRDPFASDANVQLSPSASPAMSAHHRTSSFGSDFGSPPIGLLTSSSQQSFHDGQQQQAGQWMQQRESLGGLQGLQDMRLTDRSPFLGQQAAEPQQNGGLYGYPSEAASSTSSFQSQLSHHSVYQSREAGGNEPPDGSFDQLLAGHQKGLQQQQQQQQQPTMDALPSFAVDDTSMGESESKFDPAANALTFEQVLEHISRSSDGHASASLLHHPNHSAPNISSASPWPPSSASGHSSADSEAFQQTTAPAPYHNIESAPAAPLKYSSRSPNATLLAPPLRKPTREDSFDKLKKYLKLDVNMAYAGPMTESPTTTITRKRSASDAGPLASALGLRSQGSGGNGIGFDGDDFAQLGAKLGLDFSGIDTKSAGLTSEAPTTVMVVQHPPLSTLGNNPHQWAAQQTANLRDQQVGGTSGGGASSRSSSVSWGDHGGVGPIRSPAFASTAGAGTPYASASSRRPSFAQQQNSSNGSVHRSGGSAEWSFPYNPQRPSNETQFVAERPLPSTNHRSRSSQRQNHHHRIVQSEDLTGSVHTRDPGEFLRYITAPDGSLAPPGAGLGNIGQPPASNSYGNQFVPQATRHAYQTSHDRHKSFGASSDGGSDYDSFKSEEIQGLNHEIGIHPPRSGGAQQQIEQGQGLSPSVFESRKLAEQQGSIPVSLSSPSISPGFSSNGATAGSPSSARASSTYSQTALPTYGALAPPKRGRNSITGSSSAAGGSSASSIANLSLSLVNPPVQTVTTSATQAASASRRKNDAQFICPVPGCGSHFTRQFNLRSHLRSHADERPFKCPSCDKAFARAHDAKRHHETLHLSVKKHNCEWCSRQFARLDALHRHLKPESGSCGEKQAEKDKAEGAGGREGGDTEVAGREGGSDGQGLGERSKSSPGSGGTGAGRFSGHVM